MMSLSTDLLRANVPNATWSRILGHQEGDNKRLEKIMLGHLTHYCAVALKSVVLCEQDLNNRSCELSC